MRAAGQFQPEAAADGGVQAVGGDQPARRESRGGDRVRGLADLPRPARHDPHAEAERALVQRAVQLGTADAQAAGAAEGRLGAGGAVHVPDSAQFLPHGFDAQRPQPGDAAGHDAFSAGLVDGRGPRLDDDRLQARQRAVDRGGQTGRAATGHQDVDHAGTDPNEVATPASARFSHRMRTVSTAAFTSVKTTAVTQAVCTRGRATPSATTAT